MQRFVDGSSTIRGEPWPVIERFLADPRTWLPSPGHPLGNDRWRTTVRAGRLRHGVVARVGEPRSRDDGWERRVAWSPVTEAGLDVRRTAYLPSFTGSIVLLTPRPDLVVVTVVGRYRPPFGSVGAVFDVVLLKRAATATLDELSADLARQFAPSPRLELDVPTAIPQLAAMPS